MVSGFNHKDPEGIRRLLLEECRKGNRKAQFEIYRLYHRAMFNTSLRILSNNMEAEDAMQEAFLKAFVNIENFRGEVSFGAWLKRIVVNTSLDALKKRNRALTETLEKIDIETFSENAEEEEKFSPEDIRRIRQEIMLLPEGFRVVLSLYLLEGYDHDEISQILGISPSTSRSQYSRAKQRLLLNLKKKKRS